MKNDKIIEEKMNMLEKKVHSWNETVESIGNQDAYTDFVIEEIFNIFSEIKTNYNEQFEKEPIKVYSVCSDWSTDGETGSDFNLYYNYADAKKVFDEKVKEDKEAFEYDPEEAEDYCHEETDTEWEIWRDGRYCEKHSHIWISQEKIN